MSRLRISCALAVLLSGIIAAGGYHQVGTAAPTVGIAGPAAVERFHHYDVSGTSLDELRRQVYSRGPFDAAKQQHFAGWTEWRIQWWYDFRNERRGCVISRASTKTTVTYTLPRWTDEHTAPPALRAAWHAFLDALTEHERGHGELARELARKIETAIEAQPSEPSCQVLAQRANELATRMIREDKEQEAYDLRTGHGLTQGAAFPRVLVKAP